MKKHTKIICTCLLAAVILAFGLLGAGSKNVFAAENLIVNGGGEDGMTGWTDTADPNDYSDGLWAPSTSSTGHDPKEGETFFWPSLHGCEYALMYQDVDISGYKAGTWMTLSAWLANFNQSPHDQATLRLEYLNSKGKVLSSDSSQQRNPEWELHVINLQIPSGAVTARVSAIATRFVGSDNDAYFDDIQLEVADGKLRNVVITGDKDKVSAGDTLQLSATDGKYSKASDFEWSSSYDSLATVDEKGLVTVISDEEEVWIYAKCKKTGVTGKYYINSELKNEKQDTTDTEKPDPVKITATVTVTLKWKKVEGVNGYVVYKLKDNGKYEKVKTIKKASTVSCKVSGLKSGNTYTYVVRSYKTVGDENVFSEDSNTLRITIE